MKTFFFCTSSCLKHCGNYASYALKLQEISEFRVHSVCFVTCCVLERKGVITLKALVFLMEMDLAHATALVRCYVASTRGTRHSVRTAILFALFVVDCRIDSHTLETKSNTP